MQIINGVDGAMAGADDQFNKYLGDGADPTMAPPGQFTMDADGLLAGLTYVEVKEKASAIEAMSAFAGAGQEFEMPNKYKILNGEGQRVMFAVEGTDMCTRQAKGCCQDCAAWNVQMRVVNENGEAEEAFELSRPWTCTCCCFSRPTVTIKDVRKDEEIATLVDPCNCCDMTFTVKEHDEDALYVKGGCCQWGLCCPLPCGPCATVEFTAETPDGQHVGSITKTVPSCLKFIMAPDVDNYKVDFHGDDGEITDTAQKIAMMAIAIFIDFRYFSQNENAEDEDGDHIPDRFDFFDDSQE